jgi:hypothetical protein
VTENELDDIAMTTKLQTAAREAVAEMTLPGDIAMTAKLQTAAREAVAENDLVR